jgi:two-component system, OmpR family, response regulator
MLRFAALRQGPAVHILIVEDDERIVSFMKRGLEAEDFTVDVATGASQAIEMVNDRFYDLLIIDIFLGPDDGLDLCQTLHQRPVESPILMMTAKGTPETEKASKKAGADAYLAKPFAFEDLIATIARLRTHTSPAEHRREVRAK